MADVNTQWLSNLKLQIDAIPDCQSLNTIIAKLKELFEQLIDDILNQISKLIGLIIPPTSLAKVIKYLKTLATQYLAPYLAAIRQLAQMVKAFAEVLQAIQNKMANLHCSISPTTVIAQLKTTLTTATYKKLYSGNSTLAQLTDLTQKLKAGVPPLNIIATQLGTSVTSLPAIADQYGGSLPFMSAMLDKFQPAPIPSTPTPSVPSTPTQITLDNPAPFLETVTPTLGDSAGGTVVTLTGTGFLSGCTVLFGDTEPISIVSQTDTTIVCNAPAGPTGFPINVSVTNTDGQISTKEMVYSFVSV